MNKLQFFKDLYNYDSKVYSDCTYTEIQVSVNIQPNLNLCLVLQFQKDWEQVYFFNLDLFGLFGFRIRKSEKEDHAGITRCFKFFGLELDWDRVDIRHWNDEKDCPEEINKFYKNE